MAENITTAEGGHINLNQTPSGKAVRVYAASKSDAVVMYLSNAEIDDLIEALQKVRPDYACAECGWSRIILYHETLADAVRQHNLSEMHTTHPTVRGVQERLVDLGPITDPAIHTIGGKPIDDLTNPGAYGRTHDMECPACLASESSFTSSPRSETYWSS